MMRPAGRSAAALLGAMMLQASVGRADVDATGTWLVRTDTLFVTVAVEQFVQTGTTLTSSSGFSGSINPVSGGFSQTRPGPPLPVFPFTCGEETRIGTVATDGNSFVATGTLRFTFTPTTCFMGVGAGFQGARCGSGTVDDPEACDDGNLVGGDGCSAACAIEPCWGCAGEPSVCTPLAAGSACSDDNPCTDDACDGAGACAHVNNMEPCGDGVCETGACSGGTCVLTFDPPGTPCDNDGNLCTLDFCSNGGGGGGVCIGGPPLDCSPCGTCDPALGCVPQPSPVCQAGLAGSSVELRTDADPARRKITWRWRGTGPSAADFGNPPLVSDYDVCVYLGPPGLATTTLTARAPAGGTCGGHGDSCWRATKSGYSYRDRDATPDGLTALKLSSRSPGSATISLKGKGQNLRLPPALQAGTDVTALVELRRTGGAGQCWSTEISPSTSTAARFKGKTK